MPKNRKLQNIIGVEHITDSAEAAIAAQASGGATVAFKNVAVSGQDNVVADAATDTLTLVGGSNVTLTTDASADSVTIAAADTVRTVTAGGNTLAAGETLAFTEGTNITISESAGAVTIAAAGGGSAFAPTAQVWRSASNVRNNITGLSPYTQGDDTSSNHPTSLERIFFAPFIAPETVAITKLSVYVSSANANSPNVLFGIYTATDHTATNILQRIPNALQMSATIATASSGYNDGAVSAASGGSTTITQGTLYYIAYVPVASASGYSTLQAWNGRHAPLGVSTGNAIQSVVQYTPYSYGDGLAASFPTTYQSAAVITGAAVANVFYRVD